MVSAIKPDTRERGNTVDKAIVRLPEDPYTSVSSRTRSKHWIKSIEKIDRNQSSGYAFIGTFSNFNATVELPIGRYLLSYAEDFSGAGRLRGRTVRLYQVKDEGISEIEAWDLGPESGWALQVRDVIADIMESASDSAQLRAERERLIARLAEIDAALSASSE